MNRRFYQQLQHWYFWALGYARFPAGAPKDAEGRDALSLIRLLTRLLFAWFIKEKGLVPETLFDERALTRLLRGFAPADPDTTKSVYYRAILQNLFFATLNQEPGQRGWAREGQNFMAHSLYRYRDDFADPEHALDLFRDIPFLNGGLFECLDRDLGEGHDPRYLRIDGFSRRPDSQPCVPDVLFFGPDRDVDLSEFFPEGKKKLRPARVRGLIRIFQDFKFTVEENTPLEEDVALDPELLGRVFENLLAAFNPETQITARKQTGSFYTPREIVDYMVGRALFYALRERLAGMPKLDARLEALLAYDDAPNPFKPTETAHLITTIDALKILDPACGSGAFPMGVLHRLVHVLRKLDPGNERWKQRQLAKAAELPDATVREKVMADIDQAFDANELGYGRKLYLIENCLYGVDIQPIACQIAKLRFFISLVVEQRECPGAPNRGIRPLPNLETKVVAANTLIGIERPGQQLLRNVEIDAKEEELRRVRHEHFLARTLKTKAKYRETDARLRREVADLLKDDGWDATTARLLSAWDPYDQNASAPFFDPEWMFGICVGKQSRRSSATLGGSFSAIATDELTPTVTADDGFDVVIGNPPYVAKQALQRRDPDFVEYVRSHFAVAAGRDFDLFALFMERSVGLLTGNGCLCFILPSGWYSGPGFSALRRFIATQTDPQVFVNLPYDMFSEAWVDTTVFSGTRRRMPTDWPRKESSWATLKNFGKRDRVVAQQDFHEGVVRVDVATWFHLGTDEFLTRSDTEVLGLIARMRRSSKPLRSYADVQRGVTPFVPTDSPEHPNSRRAYDGVLRRYSVEPGREAYIRFDDSLAEFKPSRYFSGRRILLRELISRQMRLQACLVDEDFVTNKSIQSILPLSSDPDPRFLLALINSTVMSWFFLQCSNVGHRDDFPKIVLKETRELPIAATLGSDGARGHKALCTLVNRILAAKGSDPEADITEWDAEIDARVARLYGLTEAEFAMVLAAGKLSDAHRLAALVRFRDLEREEKT